MRSWARLALALVLGWPLVALASQPRVQASMIVSGTISVNPDGTLKSYTLREPEKLPAPVRHVIAETLQSWKFQPIRLDGKLMTTVTTTGMHLNVVATSTQGNRALLRVTGASFGCESIQGKSGSPTACPPDRSVRALHRPLPKYPFVALRDGVSGQVLLELQVGQDGKVEQAVAHQVNLFVRTDNAEFYRAMFARASLHTARKWIFHVPAVAPTKPTWTVMVPIAFNLRGAGEQTCAWKRPYGSWCAYVPGPVTPAPWVANQHAGDAGAIAANDLFVGDPRLVLETRLGIHAG